MERISREQYTKAVIACIRVAQEDTGGSRVLAQVLLSAYNGGAFQLNVAGMSNLDQRNYENAITVIRGRYELGIEPHSVVNNGREIFLDLWEEWKNLELTERAKRTCPDCEGSGRIYINPRDYDDPKSDPCERCSGTGRVYSCRE